MTDTTGEIKLLSLPPEEADEQQADLYNPYALNLDSPESMLAIRELTASGSRIPYLNKISCPDMAAHGRELVVYKLFGSDPAADLARAAEGEVIAHEWKRSPETTQKESERYDGNSIFFLVVDVTNPQQPKVAASLRAADIVNGPSETHDYYLQDREDGELPQGLQVNDFDRRRGVWDIVNVVARQGYRDGMTSVWAYHALYRESMETGIYRWITNVTSKEKANLLGLGIPFLEVPGTEPKLLDRPGKDPVEFSFHTCQVPAIADSMKQTIAAQEEAVMRLQSETDEIALRLADACLVDQVQIGRELATKMLELDSWIEVHKTVASIASIAMTGFVSEAARLDKRSKRYSRAK